MIRAKIFNAKCFDKGSLFTYRNVRIGAGFGLFTNTGAAARYARHVLGV